jgi:hypothetical protein
MGQFTFMCSGEISMGQVGQVHVLLEYFGNKTGSFSINLI